MTFLKKFDTEYSALLNPSVNWNKRGVTSNLYQRSDGFRLIFDLLENTKKGPYTILETGTLRNPGKWTEGQSSVLFQEFVKMHGGKVFSVDINPIACGNASAALDAEFVSVHCGDSVEYLTKNDWSNVDCFHLDSYDVKWGKPGPSAEHHLKEFLAIEKYLKPGIIVAIDDNTWFNGNRTGKGLAIYNYLKSKGISPIYDDYQIIYKF